MYAGVELVKANFEGIIVKQKKKKKMEKHLCVKRLWNDQPNSTFKGMIRILNEYC